MDLISLCFKADFVMDIDSPLHYLRCFRMCVQSHIFASAVLFFQAPGLKQFAPWSSCPLEAGTTSDLGSSLPGKLIFELNLKW